MNNVLRALLCAMAAIAAAFAPDNSTALRSAMRECTNTCVHSDGSHIRDWDVSRITDMEAALMNLGGFNANISSWNTSGVTNFR